ncbi:MAG: UDP-N-acetylmuramate--alanine ligase [Spirochaetales bacterium]|nr:UDP-N-acetylmuramate--alanine ligase [Spirochaetales bacterium]
MKIHLSGIGGIAMGNLAAMLQEIGHTVTGSDHGVYPPMSIKLAEWQIEVRPFAASNIGQSDLYIVGNALSRGNPEVEAILRSNAAYMSLPQALYEFFLKGKEVIVIAGTHGKTTTTFLVHHILSEAGLSPGFFAGGVRADGHDGFAIGQGSHFVIEGDEYDSAFFDKTSKFMHYHPYRLVLTAVEFDHADIFEDPADYERAFARLLQLVPDNGIVVASRKDSGSARLLKNYKLSPVTLYGEGTPESYQMRGRTVYFPQLDREIQFPLIGRHNARNACAAIAVARSLKIKDSVIARALETFSGIRRRQEIHLETDHAVLIEDFAHHPTAVHETLAAVHEAWPDHRLIALFEPRSASAHRKLFQKDYAGAFGPARDVYITEVYNKKKVPAKELLQVRTIVAALKKARKNAIYAPDPAGLLKLFQKELKKIGKEEKLAVVAMSNGSFGGIYEKLREMLRAL